MADKIFEPEVGRSLKRIADWGAQPLGIECKKTESPYLPFDRVKDHQIEGLLRFEKYGLVKKIAVPAAPGGADQRFQIKTEFDYVYVPKGRAYLLVNFRFTKKSPRKDLPKGLNRCFALTPDQYVRGVEENREAGRGSLPLEWFEAVALELERVRFRRVDNRLEYGWDLWPLVK